MAFKRIPPRSGLGAEVYRQLRKAIIRGELAPGTRLVENRIGEELGVSRTPVREAISRLAAQGLVREIEGGVRIVADVEAELHDVFAIRQLLEGFAARLAATNATEEELAEIGRVCHESARAVDSRSVTERAALNALFHGAIAKAAHSDRLFSIINEFYEYAITEDILPFLDTEHTRQHVAQHAEVYEALAVRDGERAEATMKAHLGSIMEAVGNAIRTVRSQPMSEEDAATIRELENALDADPPRE